MTYFDLVQMPSLGSPLPSTSMAYDMNVWQTSTTKEEQNKLANANLYDCWDICECIVCFGDIATQGDAYSI